LGDANPTNRYGKLFVNRKILRGEVVQAMPEFDNCVQLADQNHVPVTRIIMEAEAMAYQMLKTT
jgi:uncharacterized protein (DUF111 family)